VSADSDLTVRVRFLADGSVLVNQTRLSAREFRGLQGAAGQAQSGLDALNQSSHKLGESLGGIARQMMGLAAAVLSLDALSDKMVDMERASAVAKSQFDATADSVAETLDLAKTVFSTGYSENLEQSAQKAAGAMRKFGDESRAEIAATINKAEALPQFFETNYQQSITGAAAITKYFGNTSAEAMDLIAYGLQRIPQFADDGIESVTEYSNLFAQAGASAEEMFSILETGAASGILGTDKIADSFKEFSIRVWDSKDSISEAYAAIGIDQAQLQADISSGIKPLQKPTTK